MRKIKRWSPVEDETLRKLYGHVSQDKIARKLHRSTQSVYARCHFIGLVGGFSAGRGRPPTCGQYFGPRLTINQDDLPTGVVRVVRHRLRG